MANLKQVTGSVVLLLLMFGAIFILSNRQDQLNAPLLWAAVEPHPAGGVVLVMDDVQGLEHQELLIAPDSQYIPRDLFADAIRNLKAAGASAIVPDIYFADPTLRKDIPAAKRNELPEHNRRLKQAIASAYPQIILTLDCVPRLTDRRLGAGNRRMLENWEGILPQLPDGETIPQGHPNFSSHNKTKITHSVPLVAYGTDTSGTNRPYYALSVWAVAKAVGIAPETFVERLKTGLPAGITYPDHEPNMRLRWETDGAAGPFPQISLKEAIFCDTPTAGFVGMDGRKVDVRNKIVLIGRRDEQSLTTYQQQMQSTQLSPEQKAELMPGDWILKPDGQWVPGVVAHAYAVNTMLNLGPVRPLNPWVFYLLLGASALAIMQAVRRMPLIRSVLLFLCIGGLGVTTAFFLIRTQGIYMPVSNMMIGWGIAFIAGVFWRAYSGPPPVVSPGKGEYVVLFADINRSTELGRQLGPERMLQAKNSLWRRAEAIIRRHKGIVSNYTGDGFIAVFPLTSQAPAYALNAAIELLTGQRENPDGTDLELKIGMTHGEIVFGEMGGASKRDYTVTGFPVDLASRLCNLAPQLEMCLLIEETTHWRADAAQAGLTDCGRHAVKGSEPIHLYGLPVSTHIKTVLSIDGGG